MTDPPDPSMPSTIAIVASVYPVITITVTRINNREISTSCLRAISDTGLIRHEAGRDKAYLMG